MKTKLISAVLCATISMASCTSESVYKHDDNNQKSNYEELILKLDSYNQTFLDENQQIQTRSFWKRLKSFLFADASGAIFGSMFGGVGSLFGAILSSATIGPAFEETNSTYSITTFAQSANEGVSTETEVDDESALANPNDSIIEQPQTDVYSSPMNSTTGPGNGNEEKVSSQVQSVTTTGNGYLHNKILFDIELKNPNIYNQVNSQEHIASLIIEEMKLHDSNISDENASKLLEKCKSILSKSNSESDPYEVLKNTLPEYSKELQVLDNFISCLLEMNGDIETIQKYLQGYLFNIADSNLDNKQKEILKESIEVAANSAVLWHIK